MDIAGSDTFSTGAARVEEDSARDTVTKPLKDAELPAASCGAVGRALDCGPSADDCTLLYEPAVSGARSTAEPVEMGGFAPDGENQPEALAVVRTVGEKVNGSPCRQEASDENPAASNCRSTAVYERAEQMMSRQARLLNVCDEEQSALREGATREAATSLNDFLSSARGAADGVQHEGKSVQSVGEESGSSPVQHSGDQQFLAELGEMLGRKQDAALQQLLAAELDPTQRNAATPSRSPVGRRSPALRGSSGRVSSAAERSQLAGRDEECCPSSQNEVAEEALCFDPTVRGDGDNGTPRRRNSRSSCLQHTASEHPLQSGLESLPEAGVVSAHNREGLSSGSTRSEASVSDYPPSPSCEIPGNTCPSPTQESHLERDDASGKQSEAAADAHVDGVRECPCTDNESADGHPSTTLPETGISEDLLQDAGAAAKSRAEGNKKPNAGPLDYHAMHRALPKVTGVRFQAQRNRFVAEWYEQGRTRMAYFPVKLYGFERARHLAIRCREEVLQMKNAKRGVYGESPASQAPTTRRKKGATEGESVAEESPLLKRRRLVANANPSSSGQDCPGFDSTLLPLLSRTFPASAQAPTSHRMLLAMGQEMRRGFSSENPRSAALQWKESGQPDAAADTAIRSLHSHAVHADIHMDPQSMGFEGFHEEDEEGRSSAAEQDTLQELLKSSRLSATSSEELSATLMAGSRSFGESPVSRQASRATQSDRSVSRLNAVDYALLHASLESAGQDDGLTGRHADWEVSPSLAGSPERLSWKQESSRRPSKNIHDRRRRTGTPPVAGTPSVAPSCSSPGLGVDPNLLLTLLLGTDTNREKAPVEHALQSMTSGLEHHLTSSRGLGRQRVHRVSESSADDSSVASSEPEYPRLSNGGSDGLATSIKPNSQRVPYANSSTQFEAARDSECSVSDVPDERLLLTKAAVSVILSDLLEKCIPRLITMGKEATEETALQLRRGFFTSVVMQAWRAVQEASCIDQLYPLLAVCRRAIVAGELPSSWTVDRQQEFFVQLVGRGLAEAKPRRGGAAASARGELKETGGQYTFAGRDFDMHHDGLRDQRTSEHTSWSIFPNGSGLEGSRMESGTRDLTAF
ncbi:unnamed protein product [Neospora caninum Liverpool]|uniref:AP2 domain transcription factor AP2VIIa-1 n=1 Tax=Neospora caninum (strain Liverpool) TaxID=572307 RepID=F0VEN5_NEOCL|nr:uncharacterized protein NCLIV_019680 [Neospora caninum Liverpool]CBZ52179.1 unnamed protein product [Neospora caninum Liverpool]CEL66146.1 TPA: AP2 domain transcription factor AP2VIIa-1 [Neospora caninum Liverpool]|eukprot:XP_003882211.1 uncharacterized protein NCLIV_019680 [Neospora caninum Liverpool]